jgi:hypothetical protein
MPALSAGVAERLILAVRFSLGPLSYLAPRFTGRVMLLPAGRNDAMPYLVRLFGIRDLALGVGALLAPQPTRQRILRYSAVIDAADAVAAVFAGTRGDIPVAASVEAALAGSVGAGLGLIAGALEVRVPTWWRAGFRSRRALK